MMYKLFVIICISCVVAVYSHKYVVQPVVLASCDVFNRSGITCSDCSTLTRCVLINNAWQSYDVDKCDVNQGQYCNSFEQQCSKSIGSCNRPIEFVCSEEGYFPDPFTCQEHYLCIRVSQKSEIIPYRRYCESGSAYSASTQACTLRLDDPVCLEPQWQCNYPGDLGLWPGSDDVFFLCVRNPATNGLFPVLHKCLGDQIFDGLNCVARNVDPAETG